MTKPKWLRVLRRHGRQPTTRAGCFLRELNLPCDILATSDDWGVTKPDVAFFSKLIAVSGHQPHGIAYVGDRLDNDLGPDEEWFQEAVGVNNWRNGVKLVPLDWIDE